MNAFSAQSQSIAHTSVSVEMFVTGLKIFFIYENCVSSHDHSPVKRLIYRFKGQIGGHVFLVC